MQDLEERRRRAARMRPQAQVHQIEGLDELAVDPEALARRLLDLWSDPGYSPPMLPRVALQVLELSHRPEVTFNEVVAVLGQDPLLSAKVVEKARSPILGGGNLRSLDEALGRLGLCGLRNLLLELALDLKVFRSATFGAPMEVVREHSVAVAHLSHLLAPRLRVDPNEAFLAGLVHDVGLAAGLLAVADALPRGSTAPVSRYWHSVEAAHVDGGRRLCTQWGMAPEIVEAVARHHDSRVGRGLDPLATAVLLADYLATRLGKSIPLDPEDPKSPSGEGTRAAVLREVGRRSGIDAEAMRALFDEASALIELLG